jgi:TPR repeat protein
MMPTTSAASTGMATTIHADAKAELNAARQAYSDLRDKMAAAINASHYDHTKSRLLARKARDEMPDPAMIVDDAGCRAAAADFRKALETLKLAVAQEAAEDEAGKAEDASAEGMKTAFKQARDHYQDANGRWNTALKGASGDLTEAKGLADQAHAALPEQVVLTDAASYQQAGQSYEDAAGKLEGAIAALARAPKPTVVDAGAAIAKGNEALGRQQFGEALKWYKTAADAGNAAAMCNVGLFYETGKGTTADSVEAVNWYTKAADKNYLPGLVNLASMYERAQDFGKAFTRYKQAADLNDVGAMVKLAHLYQEGLGTEENTTEAVKWYQKAADLNNSTAMTNLGVLYSRGVGVQLDDDAAMKWFHKAADLKNPAAMNAIGGMYDSGHGVKQDPAEAMKWYKKAADLNFAPAMTNIGTLYDNGQGVGRDSAAALTWFRKAADLGDGMGMFNIGVLYEMGRGTTQNIAEALTWYRRAEKAGDPTARQSALDRIGRLGFPP